MISIAAHFTGPNTRVMINKDWQEPLILWNVILADKGQKKSPALNRFIKPIQQLEADMNEVVGLYDEISLLYEQLDKYKSANSDRKTFLSLINGSPW